MNAEASDADSPTKRFDSKDDYSEYQMKGSMARKRSRKVSPLTKSNIQSIPEHIDEGRKTKEDGKSRRGSKISRDSIFSGKRKSQLNFEENGIKKSGSKVRLSRKTGKDKRKTAKKLSEVRMSRSNVSQMIP